ncbi:ATP synthase F0 subcomplex subunit H atp14 [Neofusicoccum ribis]|uniref:ATP synthase F0 subcomplex subunit H atp14 n=1 Tax=Neofusicoccum ribis TaxID=45134 RepID=A0ABR3SZQ6_9PEZI
MLAQTIRASRLSVGRLAQRNAVMARRTYLTPTAVRQAASIAADLVQDMYLRELKNYKPTPVKPTDAEGQVQKFAIPKPPTSPEESDLASDLKEYETQQPEVEGQAAGETSAVEEDWFEEEEEAPAAAH